MESCVISDWVFKVQGWPLTHKRKHKHNCVSLFMRCKPTFFPRGNRSNSVTSLYRPCNSTCVHQYNKYFAAEFCTRARTHTHTRTHARARTHTHTHTHAHYIQIYYVCQEESVGEHLYHYIIPKDIRQCLLAWDKNRRSQSSLGYRLNSISLAEQ